MKKISKNEYIASAYEIQELTHHGYDLMYDLRKAIEHNLLQGDQHIRIYISHQNKIVDICSYYREIPYPCLLKHGTNPAEQRVREQWHNLWGYKYQ